MTHPPNTRRWIFWTCAILLAAGLATLDAYWRWHDAGPRTRDALLSHMPPDASAVVFADLAELRGSPFATQLYNWIPKAQTDADYSQFLRETGFDYERDLDRAAIAVIKSEKDSKLFAIAEGRFDRKKIEAYASQSGTRETHGGHEIFSVPLTDAARKISFTFLGKETVALTDAADLATLLASVPATSDAREWRERFTRMAGSPIFAVIRQDGGGAGALAAQTPGGFQSPQLSTVLDQLQWISLAGKPQDNALRVVAEGECNSDQTTRQLADLLNGILLMAQAGLSGPKTRQELDPRIRDAYLELVKGAEVSRLDRGETKSVRVIFNVTPKLLEAATIPAPTAQPNADPPIPARKTPGRKNSPRKTQKN
jgi:hypothetical protein